DATAPPILEFAICCMSMISGKTSERPASWLGPICPTKCASTVAVTAMSTTLTTTFAAARRSNVETMGPSRRRCVREALCTGVGLARTACATEPLPFIATSYPHRGLAQRLDGASWENRAAADESPIGHE